MVRLKGSTLIEVLAAISIVAIVLAMAFTSISRLQGQSRLVLRFKAEQEIDRLMNTVPDEKLIEKDGVEYRLTSISLDANNSYTLLIEAYAGETKLCERKQIKLSHD